MLSHARTYSVPSHAQSHSSSHAHTPMLSDTYTVHIHSHVHAIPYVCAHRLPHPHLHAVPHDTLTHLIIPPYTQHSYALKTIPYTYTLTHLSPVLRTQALSENCHIGTPPYMDSCPHLSPHYHSCTNILTHLRICMLSHTCLLSHTLPFS